MASILSFSRRFQMWEYTVSHSQLLLRSPKSDSDLTTVDVLFKNVVAIRLPSVMEGLTISEAFEEEKQSISKQFSVPNLEGTRVFIVDSPNGTGFVIAGALAWHEDQRDYNEPSHFSMRSIGSDLHTAL